MKIELTHTSFTLKPGTKTVFVPEETRVEEISEEQYRNIVDSAPFFRRLGGSETLSRGYTPRGYRVVEITSKNPDRTTKVVRKFKFS